MKVFPKAISLFAHIFPHHKLLSDPPSTQSSSSESKRLSKTFWIFFGATGATAISLSRFWAFRNAASSVPSEEACRETKIGVEERSGEKEGTTSRIPEV